VISTIASKPRARPCKSISERAFRHHARVPKSDRGKRRRIEALKGEKKAKK
jgi:hypothetical protein